MLENVGFDLMDCWTTRPGQYRWLVSDDPEFHWAAPGGSWGPATAYANRNTELIHHSVTSKVIKSNNSRPPRTHLNLPPDGDPAEQQVASLHTNLRPTTPIWIPGNSGGLREPDTRALYETDV